MTDRAFAIISVRDLVATRSFYELLGFAQTYQFPPDGEPGFVTMERGTSSIGIGAGGAVDEDRFGYWVYVDDVDATLERLGAAGAPIVAAPED
jgi:lactoylglutathione lyase